LLNSCIPEIEVLDESDAWNPDFGVPLLTARFNMEDVLSRVEAQQTIQAGADSLLIITYKERVSVTAPPDIPGIPDIPIPVLNFAQNLPNPTSGYYRVDLINAKEGILAYGITNPYTEPIQMSITFSDIQLDGNYLQWQFTLPAAPSTNEPIYLEGTLDLSGYEIDLRNGFSTVYTAILVNSGTSVALHPFSLELKELDYSYIQGYLGQFEIEIPGDSLTFGFLETWEQGSLEFVNPELRLAFHSVYGVPVEVKTNELDFQTFINGEVSLSNPQLENGVMMNFPTINEVGEPQTTDLVLNSSNSNITSVISGVPYQLDYDLQAIANPNQDTTIINHMLDNVRLDVDIEVDIPLYGSARGFTFDSEYELDFQEFEEVERAGFKLVAENGFPIDVGLQVYFIAEDGTKVDSLYMDSTAPLIPSASIDGSGEVTAPALSESFTYLDNSRFAEIKANARRIQLVATVATPEAGSVPVRIFSHYDLILKLGFQAGL
jgi:hypothetical protein